jgi:hypothetical protein
MPLNVTAPFLGGSNLGGGNTGISVKQISSAPRDSGDVISRKCVRKAWNTAYATGTVNGYGRVCTPFRAVYNAGDFLGRVNYSCGGVQPNHADRPGYKRHLGFIPQNCDGSGIPPTSNNVKWVYAGSDYVRYKRERAFNQTYNDVTNAGNAHNAQYPYIAAGRRGFVGFM